MGSTGRPIVAVVRAYESGRAHDVDDDALGDTFGKIYIVNVATQRRVPAVILAAMVKRTIFHPRMPGLASDVPVPG